MLRPSYMKDFHCLGTQCLENCCQGWLVTIDGNTYKKYLSCADEKFYARVREYIMPQAGEDSAGNENSGVVQLVGERQICPFLRADGLCYIQKKFGEDWISKTCRTYPRVLQQLPDDTWTEALCLSCPETARLVLSLPQKITFVQEKFPVEEKERWRYLNFCELEVFQQLAKEQLIAMLQQQNSLADKLLHVNSYIWQVAQLQGRQAEKYFYRFSPAEPQQAAGNDSVRRQYEVVLALAEMIKREGINHAYHDLQEEAEIFWLEQDKKSDKSEIYHDMLSKWQRYAEANYALPLENAVVNLVFGFLFFSAEDVEHTARSWLQILLQIVVSNYYLAVKLAIDGEVTAATLQRVIQLTSKVVVHSAVLTDQAEELLRSGDLFNEQGFALLITTEEI